MPVVKLSEGTMREVDQALGKVLGKITFIPHVIVGRLSWDAKVQLLARICMNVADIAEGSVWIPTVAG